MKSPAFRKFVFAAGACALLTAFFILAKEAASARVRAVKFRELASKESEKGVQGWLLRGAVVDLVRFYFYGSIRENQEMPPAPLREMALIFLDREYMPGAVIHVENWGTEEQFYFLIDPDGDEVKVTLLKYDEPFPDFIARLKRIREIPEGEIKGMDGPYRETFEIYFYEKGEATRYRTYDPDESADMDVLMGMFGFKKPFVD